MTQAIYRVEDDRGVSWTVYETDRAARLSRAGLCVTGRMEETDGPQ